MLNFYCLTNKNISINFFWNNMVKKSKSSEVEHMVLHVKHYLKKANIVLIFGITGDQAVQWMLLLLQCLLFLLHFH